MKQRKKIMQGSETKTNNYGKECRSFVENNVLRDTVGLQPIGFLVAIPRHYINAAENQSRRKSLRAERNQKKGQNEETSPGRPGFLLEIHAAGLQSGMLASSTTSQRCLVQQTEIPAGLKQSSTRLSSIVPPFFFAYCHLACMLSSAVV